MNSSAKPQVSIIVSNYNRSAMLERCLASLLSQSYKSFEVLVCDDGSTDDSHKVAQSFSPYMRVSFLRGANSGGPAKPRNRGIRVARGEYIGFLDSDDWWDQKMLEVSIRYLTLKDADLVYSNLLLVKKRANGSWELKRDKYRQLNSPIFDDLFSHGNCIPCSSVVVRTHLMRSIGGFSEEPGLVSVEDYDAWLRLSRITERFYRINEYMTYYTIHQGNISSGSYKSINSISLMSVYSEYITSSPISMPLWLACDVYSSLYMQNGRRLCIPIITLLRTQWRHIKNRPINALLNILRLAKIQLYIWVSK